MENKQVEPFGSRYFEPASDGKVIPPSQWSWTPPVGADVEKIAITASIPGTTGTGPKASSDERTEES